MKGLPEPGDPSIAQLRNLRGGTSRRRGRTMIRYTALGLIGFTFALPLLWALCASLKPGFFTSRPAFSSAECFI